MATYKTPGVYVTEESSGIKPIAGVGTSTAAFIGYIDPTVEMPLKPGEAEGGTTYTLRAKNDPKRIVSWEEFKKFFGDFSTGNQILAHAVFGFFNNGGGACWVIRTHGDTDADQPASTDYTATLALLKAIDEVAIVAIPGEIDNTSQVALENHCSEMKDRVAIIDGNGSTTGNTITDYSVANVTLFAKADGGYATVYFPWIEVANPLYPTEDDKTIYMPPSGYMAGIYSRSDAERGVHKAPANEMVKGAVGLQYYLSKGHQETLNYDEGINVIRSFNGAIKVWGARTRTGSAEWKYINVRRTMNYIRESIEEGMSWAVFEPNDMALWQKIKRNVTAFLTNVWRDGALFGATPEEAFYVKCDAEINPPEVRDLGQVVTEIGVSLVKPAEFVIFKISQWQGEGQ